MSTIAATLITLASSPASTYKGLQCASKGVELVYRHQRNRQLKNGLESIEADLEKLNHQTHGLENLSNLHSADIPVNKLRSIFKDLIH